MKKFLKFLGIFIGMLFVTGSLASYASEEAQIIRTVTGDESVSVYVKNAPDSDEIDCLVGNKQANVDVEDSLGEIQTLVLIDNSASITKEERKKTVELLDGLVSGMVKGEKISIGTFAEQITSLCAFSSNKVEIENAISSITYSSQDAFLPELLYDLYTGDFIKGDAYKRIIIISDGADDKNIGITQNELANTLETGGVPIYSVGCTSKNNAEYLENMFSYSRITKGNSFLMADYADVKEIVSALSQDLFITKYVVTPDKTCMDGTVKAIKLSIGENVVSVETKMPQVVIEDEPETLEEPEVKEEAEKKTVVEEPATVEEPVTNVVQPSTTTSQKKSFNPLFIIIPVILLAIVAGVLFFLKNKKNTKKEYAYVSSQNSGRNSYAGAGDDVTQVLSDDVTQVLGDDVTQVLDDNMFSGHNIYLKDVYNSSVVYTYSLVSTMVIGRKPETADLVIPDSTVSSRHCSITWRDNSCFIEDLNSSNKVYVNGQMVGEARLYPGDVIKLGRVELLFTIE